MNRSLSQVLDGAAFPAIMLSVAVSPINVGPHERNTLYEGTRPVAEIQMSDRADQKVKQAEEQ